MKSVNQIEKSRDLCANYKAYTPPYTCFSVQL